ncbi:hypothetical protein [uncultured Nonlabens sp.]|uniref:hypothetical protein n=1 Tax=uncultured Nonlabens sp. TaxID=859306 RepID=UPI002621B574|nr:hypothetical protein [uncultured Nonlabens sp.]
MKNISLYHSEKFATSDHIKWIEHNIYQELSEEHGSPYRTTISYDLEFDETSNQYPLEDILNKYDLFVNDFLVDENDSNSKTYYVELGGEVEDLLNMTEIFGKKVFNRELMIDGQLQIALIIE